MRAGGAGRRPTSGPSEDQAAPRGPFHLEAARLGSSGFGPGEEGNTHSAEPAMVGGREVIVACDINFGLSVMRQTP